MKLVSFKTQAGRVSYGAVVEPGSTGIVNLGERLRDYPDLRSLIAADGWRDIVAPLLSAEPDHRLDEVSLLPVIPNPDKILCVGINYASHVVETGRDMPVKPMIFTRFSNSQIGHDAPMIRPSVSERFDFEGELAVVIGKSVRYVQPEETASCIAGFSCYNDGSVRDWQRHSTQFTPGKNFPATGAFGPWLVTAEEFGDVAKQRLITRLNGEVMQSATFDDLIFDVPALVSYCSYFTQLEPGDVIITGTTGGVGAFRSPPVWLRPGDEVEVEISGIGILRNKVIGEMSRVPSEYWN